MQRKTSKVAPSKGFPQKKLAKKLWHSLKIEFFFSCMIFVLKVCSGYSKYNSWFIAKSNTSFEGIMDFFWYSHLLESLRVRNICKISTVDG